MKPKRTQKRYGLEPHDLFQTPNYAVDLLVPYLGHPDNTIIWECACGDGYLADRLNCHGYAVYRSDARDLTGSSQYNFFDGCVWEDDIHRKIGKTCDIVTNPPYSIKKEFIFKAIEYNLPFAFLIQFDMTQWLCDVFMNYGCQALVPTRRINYIPPYMPMEKAKGAQFHSFWLTRYLNLPDRMTFVKLTKEMTVEGN